MTTAAIIGTTSMLGALLSTRLTSTGVKVVSVGRHDEADIRLDLGTGFLSSIPNNIHADVIYHCAASFASDTHKGIRENFEVNTAGSLWVLELAEKLQSEAIVYAGSLSSIETMDPGGFSSYGLTKAEAEKFLDWGMKRLGG